MTVCEHDDVDIQLPSCVSDHRTISHSWTLRVLCYAVFTPPRHPPSTNGDVEKNYCALLE
ncbi:uncharacterized protein OGAPODRAFT_15727 [Ogataea polymorpha]|uniref:uncharacterized protein n=1 Tax=Ogataea polymorpha TaxID=460523 RepID=UPI0007F4D681|nr:uncharacterized protein OGAPODRAFT_15727 [Ogataea polymorpha]OBA17457.1 hypothetical protein OGAPODRAFT_15727 [Ogataea polymorpha]